MDIVIIVESKPVLFEVICTTHSSSGFAGCLDGRQEKGDEHSDNRNDNEKFDKGKSGVVST
jgi:hypothetical protein